MKEVWSDIWNSVQGIRFQESTYMWRFYTLLLGTDFKGKHVLEIGCGTGHNTAVMAAKGAQVTFFDQSQAALDLAKKTMDAWGLEGEYIHGDAFDYTFKKKYDIVHSEGVVEHFLGKQRQDILDIHANATKKGGCVGIIVPHMKCPGYRIGKWVAEKTGNWIYGGEYPYGREELQERMKRAGLSVDTVIGGEFIFGMGWLFCPIWLRSRKLMQHSLSRPAQERTFRLNYNNLFANRWGRVIGCVGKNV